MSTVATDVISWMEDLFAETALVEEEDSAITPSRWNAFVKGWDEMSMAVAFAEAGEPLVW
ncbi:MAG: hypothetical protein ACOY3Z_08760 [Thermodesulfobacteriota bacterium]